MDIGEYKQAVRGIFEGGYASDELWEELGSIVLDASENGHGKSDLIDAQVYGTCFHCGAVLFEPCKCVDSPSPQA